MTMEFKTLQATEVADTGEVSALFSTFGLVDKDDDIVEATAFKDGQAVPLCWAHKWDKPVGRGLIKVTPNGAVFDGRFFMDTHAGKEAHGLVKAMGDLQEYSWGFRVTDSDYMDKDGRKVRVIKGATVYEVSCVLVGAGQGTRTLAIKASAADEGKGLYLDALPGSYEGQIADLNQAIRASFMAAAGPMDMVPDCFIVATYTDYCVAAVYAGYAGEATYYRIPYTMDGDAVALGTPTEVQPAFIPASQQSVADQAMGVSYRAAELVRKTKGLHERREKEGRVLSDRNRTALQRARDAMSAAVGEIDTLLTASEPQPAKAASEEQRRIDARRAFAEAQFVAAQVLAELTV